MIDEQDLDVLCYNTHSTTLPTSISMVRTLDLVEDDELDDVIDINTLDRNDPFSNSVSSASLEFSTPIEPMIPFILTGELDDNSDKDKKNLIGSCKLLFEYLGAAVLSMLFFFISNVIKSLINYINPNAELVTIDPIYKKTSSIIINTFIYSGFGSVAYGLHKFITYRLHNKLTRHEQKIEQLEKEKRIFIKNCKKYTNKLDLYHKHAALFMQHKTELSSHIISEANETCDLIKVQLEDLQQNLSHSITEELHITKLNIAVDNITKDIRQFKNTIKNASKLYKLAQNNIVIKDSDFTLNMLKDMVFTKVEKHASQKHLPLLYVTSLPSSIIFSGETNKIASILIHFISNAIKFTEKGFVKLIIREDIEHGQIAQESKKLLHFAVQDTGKGIETSELHYMFRPYKTDDLSPEKAAGTGLGLCLVSALVKHINNEYPFKHSKKSFGVRSMVGRGSIFWCRLWVSISPVTVATINPTSHNPLSNNVATTILKHYTFLKEQSTCDLNSNGSESCLMPPSPRAAQSLQAFKNQLLPSS